MPTRKQRRREAKAKRHEYEFVYVDSEGNELDEPPEELEPEAKEREAPRNGSRPQPARKASQSRQAAGRGGRRVPPLPSWRRSFRRAGILGAVVFVFFSLLSKNHSGSGYLSAAALAVLYTALFVPLTYMIDRFAYRRWEARDAGSAAAQRPARSGRPARPAKKR